MTIIKGWTLSHWVWHVKIPHCLLVRRANHISKYATFHEECWRLQICEKFSNGVKKQSKMYSILTNIKTATIKISFILFQVLWRYYAWNLLMVILYTSISSMNEHQLHKSVGRICRRKRISSNVMKERSLTEFSSNSGNWLKFMIFRLINLNFLVVIERSLIYSDTDFFRFVWTRKS